MRLTTKGRFAVTAMIDLGLRQNNGPVTLAAISQRQQISLSYLEQLFGKLPIDATQCGGKENCLGDGTRCMTHDLWTSLNSRMVEFLDSVSLQKLVDEQLAKGVVVESTPQVKKAIFASPIAKPMRVNAPNSVFALGNAFSKS